MQSNDLTAVVLVKNDQYFLRYALESTRKIFKRYVFYDVSSEDMTKEVIASFISTLPDDVEMSTRFLPMCPPSVQGCFRNSMIVEGHTNWYFILDGDEVYTDAGVEAIQNGFEAMKKEHIKDTRKIYGVISRQEIGSNLVSSYDTIRSHHRVYHRTATWVGSHPGEVPFYEQVPKREYEFPKNAMCYHFHNADRSPQDANALKRIERKTRGTYRPGELVPFDLFGTLPILKKRFDDIPVNPLLERLQNGLS